jgi:prepilin-type N-terminal cleavage/methylation domain-containing protein
VPRGVTLIELLIVMTLVALIAGLAFPAVASGLDTLRLRSASDSIVGFLNTAMDRAERRQKAVEVWISPHDNALTAVSGDASYQQRLDVPDPIHIVSIQPPAPFTDPSLTRRFLLYPGGAPPRIAIEIANQSGRKRVISIDPITGFPRSEAVGQ